MWKKWVSFREASAEGRTDIAADEWAPVWTVRKISFMKRRGLQDTILTVRADNNTPEQGCTSLLLSSTKVLGFIEHCQHQSALHPNYLQIFQHLIFAFSVHFYSPLHIWGQSWPAYCYNPHFISAHNTLSRQFLITWCYSTGITKTLIVKLGDAVSFEINTIWDEPLDWKWVQFKINIRFGVGIFKICKHKKRNGMNSEHSLAWVGFKTK